MHSYPDCALTGTLLHGPRDYYDMRYAIRYGSHECDMRCECVMGRANAIFMRYANTLRAARECDKRYANRECDMRYANRLRTMQLQSGFLGHHTMKS